MGTMEAVDKLKLFDQQMNLEPAEETDSVARPAGWVDPNRRAPCGYSPAELRAAVDASPDGVPSAITQGHPDPTAGISRKVSSLGIYHAAMPGGKRLAMLKTMLTSACERNCYYCPF